MHFTLDDDTLALQKELRAYFDALLTPEVRRELHHEGERGGPTRDRVMRRMGADGWLGIGWPTEYGGSDRGPAAQFVLFSEAYRAGAPLPMITLTTVAPTLMAHGSPEQKAYFLPRILAGELVFAIGYTEPEAGTDLASLRTTARREGDELVINGNKVFTSGADGADWIWLAARTDQQAPKHKGISLILVPTTDPGFSATPIRTVGGVSTTATYYDNVRVPVGNVVGGLDNGWKLITTQLNHERVGLAAFSGISVGLLEDAREWAARQTLPDGRPYTDLPWVRAALGRATALANVMSLMNWRLVEATADEVTDPGQASAAKVYATEAALEIYRLTLEVVGAAGLEVSDAPAGITDGRLALMNLSAQINTFGGGVAEIQREIVAWTTLGMTRGTR
ncbi:acyl-CoA dehydrogenase family protein [Intrasporangium sp.]|uniref:acyl-CoA dehydrogenase family protein n=1 Tax=Intrasporangium sp. TaxID=1925024 RepID=UPI003221ECB5